MHILNIIDEYTRECLAVRVERHLSHREVLEELTWLFCARGLPAYIRSANGPEFTAERVRDWRSRLNVGPLFIEKGSPWENGYLESFNGKMRDELSLPTFHLLSAVSGKTTVFGFYLNWWTEDMSNKLGQIPFVVLRNLGTNQFVE